MMMSQNIIKGLYIIILSIRKNPNLDLRGKTSKLALNLTEKLRLDLYPQKMLRRPIKKFKNSEIPFLRQRGQKLSFSLREMSVNLQNLSMIRKMMIA
jgi:hypothetical protein